MTDSKKIDDGGRDLTSLIERLEKAEGPSRYDDCHLWVIAKGGDARMRVCDSSTKDFVWERGVDGMWVRDVVKFSSVPKYTSSIDAAVSLAERVLPGWDWGVESFGEDGAHARVWKNGWHDDSVVRADHASPMIALLLATLRALQSRGDA